MKFITFLSMAFLAAFFWQLGEEVSRNEVQDLVIRGELDYGPLPLRMAKNYDFTGLPKAFHSDIDLSFLSTLTKYELKNFLLVSTHKLYRDKLAEHLDMILELSESYKVDPIWVLSVISVESGFNPKALSHKNAQGLMQVRPDTAKHLKQLLNKSAETVDAELFNPEENLELGVFYLKKLLQNFRYNYAMATVAYNVGPNSLRTKVSEEDFALWENNYLKKVDTVYRTYLTLYLKLVKGKTYEASKSRNIIAVEDSEESFKVASLTKSYFQRFYYSERL